MPRKKQSACEDRQTVQRPRTTSVLGAPGVWRAFGAQAAALMIALALVAAPTLAQSRAELEKVLRRRVLANGMEIVVVARHSPWAVASHSA